jgi:hypothetical protein
MPRGSAEGEQTASAAVVRVLCSQQHDRGQRAASRTGSRHGVGVCTTDVFTALQCVRVPMHDTRCRSIYT